MVWGLLTLSVPASAQDVDGGEPRAVRPTDVDGWGPKWDLDEGGSPTGHLTFRPLAAGVAHTIEVRVVGASLDVTVGPDDLGVSDGTEVGFAVTLPAEAALQRGLVLIVVKATALRADGRVLAYMASDRVYVSGSGSIVEGWSTESAAQAAVDEAYPPEVGEYSFGIVGREVTP